jgi:hypothetical protein
VLALGVVAGLAAAALCGADWARLADVRWRLWPLVLVGSVLQLVLYGQLEGRTLPDLPYAPALYVASNLLVLASLGANARVRGALVMLLGGTLNLAAIAANGGQMPSLHRGMTDATPLHWLADWIELPFVPRREFSVGDVLLAVGAAVVVYTLARRQAPAEARAGSAEDAVPSR